MTSQRQKDRARRTEQFWAEKKATAASPAAKAHLTWDQVRSDISHASEDIRDDLWEVVHQHLDMARHKITQRQVRK